MGQRAWGDALVSIRQGEPLECWFPNPALGHPVPGATQLAHEVEGAQREDRIRQLTLAGRRMVVEDLDRPLDGTLDAYLRLHLLSHRLVRPNEINLEGLFGVLPNIAWTSIGPVHPADLPKVRQQARTTGLYFSVDAIDRFPRMLDYVVPSGVRVADGRRVRLGAFLSEGTTVMHEGFVNFNAGTLGASMVEGRISQGVVIGEGSDIGGGASMMGTLSGGGQQRVSMGKRCLLGANAGLGIALGDDCVVEAGLYLTAGTVVITPNGRLMKARELSGQSSLLFRRNSQTGAVEALPRSDRWNGLNADLHSDQ